MLGYRPPVYFWKAEYRDGSVLSQFDPETGKENLFSEVDHSRLKRFGWHPFSPSLARKILEAEKVRVTPTANKSHAVTLERGDKLVAYRTNTISLSTRKAGVDHSETVYVLGVEDGKTLQITEDGTVTAAKVEGEH